MKRIKCNHNVILHTVVHVIWLSVSLALTIQDLGQKGISGYLMSAWADLLHFFFYGRSVYSASVLNFFFNASVLQVFCSRCDFKIPKSVLFTTAITWSNCFEDTI